MADVELQGLTKRYGDQTVVNSVDLKVGHGQLVCLLGPSGCGKTTTLRLIAGFLEPDAGTIRVGDRLLSGPGQALPPEQRGMSMIFQSYALWPHMTIADNVAYGLTLRRLDRAEIDRRVQTILEVTQMAAFAQRYPGELSGGQQQRVALARALVVQPETLLLDEPLSNLDANLREEMRFEVRRLHDQYKYTTVYVTHDQAEAMTTADMIVVMNKGRIEQAGTPVQIFEEPETEFVARFLGGTNILRGRHVGDNMVQSGAIALSCARGRAGTGEVAVSIRPHRVELHTAQPAGDGRNVATAQVRRQVFLGVTRDYLVTLEDGTELRAITTTDVDIAAGAAIWIRLPPNHCRALAS
ncbi:MAG: ABC transporter ATP-binding protein [Alphaproteobacteria bacterium]|nr:ABC transporter ATP-binding protein [Alphaproteobacteria bacterium]